MQKIDTAKLKYIDISMIVHAPEEPFGPDDMSTRILKEQLIWPIKTYNSAIDNSTYQILQLKSHCGTHVECPNHQFSGGKSLDEFPVETWLGRMVKFSFDLGEKELITREMVETADRGRLQPNDIALVHSNCGYDVNDINNPNRTRIESAAVNYMIDKGIKMFAFDNTIGFAIENPRGHDILLSKDIPLLELITNLGQLTQDVAYLIALPGFNLRGNDASPTRAVVIEGAEFL